MIAMALQPRSSVWPANLSGQFICMPSCSVWPTVLAGQMIYRGNCSGEPTPPQRESFDVWRYLMGPASCRILLPESFLADPPLCRIHCFCVQDGPATAKTRDLKRIGRGESALESLRPTQMPSIVHGSAYRHRGATAGAQPPQARPPALSVKRGMTGPVFLGTIRLTACINSLSNTKLPQRR